MHDETCTFNKSLNDAICKQQRVGNNQIIYGCLVKEWEDVQCEFDKKNNNKKTVTAHG